MSHNGGHHRWKYCLINPGWPSDPIWWQRSESTLNRVMIWCICRILRWVAAISLALGRDKKCTRMTPTMAAACDKPRFEFHYQELRMSAIWFKSPVMLTSTKTSKLFITDPMWGESTGDQWIPPQWSGNVENVSIWRQAIMCTYAD